MGWRCWPTHRGITSPAPRPLLRFARSIDGAGLRRRAANDDILAGLGPLTGSTRVQLRAEAKFRLELFTTNYDGIKNPHDTIFDLGL